MSAIPLLDVRDLTVEFQTRRGVVRAVEHVDISVARGETVAIVGESGSGKSVTSYAVMRILDRAGRIADGQVMFTNIDVRLASEDDMRDLRGREISMIFQNPRAALNPIRKVGRQIEDVLLEHAKVSPSEATEKAVEILDQVKIARPRERYHAYPFELSGGMCQRVVIALALACRPQLLIADEPTTGLDATIQSRIVNLLGELKEETGTTTLLISHDISVIQRLADRVAIMYGGTVVESGRAADVLAPKAKIRHPYTSALLASIPSTEDIRQKKYLHAIEGEVLDTINVPRGCRFYGRCNRVTETIRESCAGVEPPLAEVAPGHKLRCWLYPAASPESRK
jgi:peptide/nickel transport system ATP-binding protein